MNNNNYNYKKAGKIFGLLITLAIIGAVIKHEKEFIKDMCGIYKS